MAGSELSITLEGGGPWGFRLQGGKDFGTPLTIAKVTPGGKAERAGVKVGDLILSINGQPCDTITHFDAQDAVKRSGQTLSLRVNRGNTEREKKILTITETVHSGGVDHKYNAKPKPFGAPSPAPKPYVASYAGPAQTGAPGGGGGVPPAPPPPPSAFQHQGLKLSRPAKDPDDYRDSEVLKALQKDDDALAERFKLTISDDGDVSFEGEQPSWHHAPPNPHVQSKTFKMLQKHLQDEDDDDDLPPPPPEAYQQDDTHQPVKSRSMKVLEDQIDRGEAPASVFSRQQDNRSKPSSTPVPQFYRPSPPKIKTANQPLVPTGPAPVMARPGQPAPVALPGMVEMQPSQPQPSRQPPMQTSRPAAPQMRRPGGTSTPSSAPAPPPPAPAPPPTAPAPPPTAPSYGNQSRQAPQQQHGGAETKRQPVKPASPTGPREGPRTPYCESCQEEIFGPFVSAIGRSWHPEHFVCAGCGESLQNQGFIEEGGKVYCEKDYNRFFAPHCDTCKEPIVGPKSLHACPKPVAAPGSDILRAIRESSRTGLTPEEIIAKQKHREPHVNTALNLNKRTTLPKAKNNTYLTFGINYNVPKAPTVDRNSNHSRSWSDSDRFAHGRINSTLGFTPSSRYPLTSDRRLSSGSTSSTSSFSSFKSYADIESTSLREKVVQMKEEIKNFERCREEAEKQKIEARKRIQEARKLFYERQRKIIESNEKLEKVQEKLDKAERRLVDRRRHTNESLYQQERLRRETYGEEREIKNVQYEIFEARSSRELTQRRLKEIAHRLCTKQQALEQTENLLRKRLKQAKALEDLLSSFKMKIKNIQLMKAKNFGKTSTRTNQVHVLEQKIRQRKEQCRVTEVRYHHLAVYSNELQNALQATRKNISKAKLKLSNYKQRMIYHGRFYY